jgi:hypothetical protein
VLRDSTTGLDEDLLASGLLTTVLSFTTLLSLIVELDLAGAVFFDSLAFCDGLPEVMLPEGLFTAALPDDLPLLSTASVLRLTDLLSETVLLFGLSTALLVVLSTVLLVLRLTVLLSVTALPDDRLESMFRVEYVLA